LRGKLHLDFRNGNIDNTDNFRRLIEFLKPELRRRKELLRELRSGLTASSESEIRLREFALRGTDQLIQQAALTGLAKIRHPSSVAIITERLLNDWGLNTLNHSIRLLGKLGVDGLAGLAAGAFWDDRLAGDILRVLTYGLQSDKRFAKHINENIHDNGISLMSASVALSDHSPEPVASAFRFSSQYWFEGKKKPFFLPKLSQPTVRASKKILDEKLPGLTEMISRQLEFRGHIDKETENVNFSPLYEINSTIFLKI